MRKGDRRRIGKSAVTQSFYMTMIAACSKALALELTMTLLVVKDSQLKGPTALTPEKWPAMQIGTEEEVEWQEGVGGE